MIVFSHMMKTAGTSFVKLLIQHFGNRMHVVPGGLNLKTEPYNFEKLSNDLIFFDGNLRVLSGHPVRPYIDYGHLEENMNWITFFREPEKRYVSHYFHNLNWAHYYTQDNVDKSLEHWERRLNASNYQVKFIAGEENLQKAIDIIHDKFEWVGFTEMFDDSIDSFKNHFREHDFFSSETRSNSSLSEKDRVSELFLSHGDFIKEKNELDRKLYDYVKENIWTEQIESQSQSENQSSKNILARRMNFIRYHLKRHNSFQPSEVNLKNLKRFYTRWIR